MTTIGEDSTGDPRDIDEIVTILRNAGRAMERHDVDGVIAMFDNRATTALFDFLAPGVTTVDDIRENAARLAENAIGALICSYPKITVRILSPDVAYSMAYSHIDVTTGDGGRMDLHTRVTNIWCRIDGRWACVHEHSSLPMDIATGKAELKQKI